MISSAIEWNLIRLGGHAHGTVQRRGQEVWVSVRMEGV